MKTIIPFILFISSILCAEAGTTVSGGGVTQIIPGSNVTVSPSNGVGVVTVSSSGGGGGSLTLDASVTAVGFTYGSPTAGTLYLTNVNAANGLVGLDGSANLYLPGDIYPLSGSIWANPTSRIIYDQFSEQAISTVSDSYNTDSTTTLISDPDDDYVAINGSLFVRQTIQLQSFGGTTGIQLGTDGSIQLNGNGLNATGGLARLTASDGTADGSIAFLGTTDDGRYSVAVGYDAYSYYGGGAIGNGSSADNGGGAIGNYANSDNGGGAVGGSASADNGGAVGNDASSSSGGGAIGYGASSDGGGAIGNGASSYSGGSVGNGASSDGGGGAIGVNASATTGFAGGASTVETGGGANFCGGTYAGTGLAINGNEIANVNGHLTGPLQGYTVSTLPSGVIGQCAYVTDALTPTFGAPLVGGGTVVAKAFYDGTNWINE